jgi:hypothetical protein
MGPGEGRHVSIKREINKIKNINAKSSNYSKENELLYS